MAKKVGLVGAFQGAHSLIEQSLERLGYELHQYSSVDQFLNCAGAEVVDEFIIFLDLSGALEKSVSRASKICSENDNVSWVILHDKKPAYNIDEIEQVIDYELLLPVTEERLQRILIRAVRLAITRRKLKHFNKDNLETYRIEAFVGRSEAASKTRALIKKIIRAPISSIIITGETGTGKGLTARILHYNDEHQEGDLVEVNCAGIPKDLLESILFGHEAGAFTGAHKQHKGYLEQANEGTLFLDEITEMDVDLQAKLLKAIEEKKFRRVGGNRDICVDVSIVAASNRELTKAIEEGKLREDLYHRLAIVCIDLPPLRFRKEDLLDLVPSIISEFNLKANKSVKSVEDSTWDKLISYNWPGNVRELRNVLERSVLFAESDYLPEEWLMLENTCTALSAIEGVHSESKVRQSKESDLMRKEFNSAKSRSIRNEDNAETLSDLHFTLDGNFSIEEIEIEVIKRGLRIQNGNVTETARLLGISREKLRYRMKKYSIKN